MKKLKKKWWVVIAVVAILAIAGVVAFFLLRDKEDGSKKKEKKEELALEELTYDKLAQEEYEYYLTEETDTDGDGLPDIAEREEHGTEPFACDTDGDGLDDGSEINEYSTEPNNADTDGDGLLDGVEILAGLDPLKEKTDDQTRDNDVAFERNYEAEGLTMVIKGDASVCDVYVDKFTQGNGGNTKALISPIYEFYKKGTFEEATITVQYEDAWIPEGGSEETLSICQFTDEEEWVKVDSVVDADNNTVTATLEHFSKYGLLDISLLGQQKTVNVMLVIDDSGSMYPEEMCEGSIESDVEFKRLDMVNSFVKDLDDSARVGAAYFTGDYVKCCEMGSTDEQIATAMEAIKTSTSHNFNGTAILKSLDAALKEFSYGSTEANFIIILTDGESTEGGINSLFASYSRNSVINEAKQKNVKIITVGLGAGVKADYLRDFSDNTDGMYIYANNATTLSMMYKKLQDVINDTYIDVDGDGVVDEVLVADSGFDMTTEALSFENPILKTEDKFQCGLCAGIAIFTHLNHVGRIPAQISDFGFTDYDLWGMRAIAEITNFDNIADDVVFTRVKGYEKEDLEALGFEIKNGIVIMENVRDTLCSDTTDAMMEIRELDAEKTFIVDENAIVFRQEILDKYSEFLMLAPHTFKDKCKYKGIECSSYERMVYDYTKGVDEKTAQIFAFLARFQVEQFKKESYAQYELNKDFEAIVDLIRLGEALYMEIPGHGINAVKVTRDFDNVNLYYLYVYDNNYTNELQKYTLEKTSNGTMNLTSPSGEPTTAFFRDYFLLYFSEQ